MAIVFKFIFLAMFVCQTNQADVSFDDSYAQRTCDTTEMPDNENIAILCLEIMQLGKWYSENLEKIGLKEPSIEVQIEPTHPNYIQVRNLGIEVDILAQELMLLMARESCHEEEARQECQDITRLETTLYEMIEDIKTVPMLDALTTGVLPTTWNNGEDVEGQFQSQEAPNNKKELQVLDTKQLIEESQNRHLSLREIIVERRQQDYALNFGNQQMLFQKKMEKKRKKKSKKKL